MLALAARLRDLGYAAAWATPETTQGVEDPVLAEPAWLEALWSARSFLPAALQAPEPDTFVRGEPLSRLHRYLAAWAARVAPRPLVLLLDEADTVSGPAMVSLLRQLRAGFAGRAVGTFPVSVALVGMRDLRDYLAAAKGGQPVNPGSPFNVKAASVTLRNFTASEVGTQHTTETGQRFTDDAVERAFWWTRGQPFLVNALARICTLELVTDRAQPIDAARIEEAKERLILSRTTHLDALGQRLREAPVARVMVAVLEGQLEVPYASDDYQYCIDLGLLADDRFDARVSCPLYREVLVRELTIDAQGNTRPPRAAWTRPDGSLDAEVLVETFRRWWRENADVAVGRIPEGWRAALVHLTFMAFLQRVVNGGGRVLREFAAGRGAVDLVVEMGPGRVVIELKRLPRGGPSLDRVRDEGAAQLAEYLDSLDEPEGWLLVFDQRPGRSWEERLWSEERQVAGRRIRMRGA